MNKYKALSISQLLILIYLILTGTSNLIAQTITATEKQEVLRALIDRLSSSYINESKALEMTSHLHEKIWDGTYDSIDAPEEFAFLLTRELRNISQDLHLEIVYNPNQPLANSEEEEENENAWLKNLLEENGHGVKSKKILEGNLGYLELPFFGPIDHCADTLFKAMEELADTDALIVDLRSCRGSLDENMIPLFCGYFFEEPVHLFDFENRQKNSLRQFWSSAYVPGKKYLHKPVYILISGRTFSGGEEFAYDMKHLGRATLVGQVTKGGAQPKYPVQLSKNFLATIPMERSINAMTGTNWEAIGVEPDVEAHSELALYTSQVLIFEELIQKEQTPDKSSYLNITLNELKKNPPTLRKIKISLAGYSNAKEVAVSGTFNFWSPKTDKLQQTENGWEGFIEATPGIHEYQLVIDDRWTADPENPIQIKKEGRINSVLQVD